MKTPPRADALSAVCRLYFPAVDPARVDEEAVGADILVRREIEGRRVRKMRRGQSPETSFTGTANRADILRRARDAIDRCDAWAWKKANAEMDEPTREFYEVALAAAAGGEAWMHSYGELAIDAIGPTPECVAAEPQHWQARRAALEHAVGSLQKGRPPATNHDEAIRALVGLWEILGGRKAVQPSYQAGGSRRSGSLADFIADAVMVYEPEGLHRSAPNNSGAAWRRILSI